MFGIDAPIWAAGISGLANLGGGFMSAAGASAANDQNMRMNERNLDFQNNVNAANWEHQQATNRQSWNQSLEMNAINQAFAREMTSRSEHMANQQMAFQERMSSSAYQRATADMRLAGINPMLAYMQGGASSPAGAMGSASSAQGQAASASNSSGSGASASFGAQNTQVEMGRAVGRIAQSAVDAYKTTEEGRQLRELQERTEAEKHLTKNKINTENWETDRKMHDAALTRDARFLQNAQTDTERQRAELVKAQKGAANASSAASYASARRDHASATNEELRNREARPTSEGGYGRGTGVGPAFPERILRNMQDTVTDNF